MKTILLLLASNVFMTAAWYGHLKVRWFERQPLIVVILAAWAERKPPSRLATITAVASIGALNHLGASCAAPNAFPTR